MNFTTSRDDQCDNPSGGALRVAARILARMRATTCSRPAPRWRSSRPATPSAACRRCGTEAREGARFCDGCGAPVTAHDTHAEYKQVTVLFADVVHSMDIAAAVGAERWREIMADLADRCAAVVRRYGGTVDKFTGDGIMAVF